VYKCGFARRLLAVPLHRRICAFLRSTKALRRFVKWNSEPRPTSFECSTTLMRRYGLLVALALALAVPSPHFRGSADAMWEASRNEFDL
jgi:hypothetical protein